MQLEYCIQRHILTFTKRNTDDESNHKRGDSCMPVRRGRVLANRGATSFDKYERHGYNRYNRYNRYRIQSHDDNNSDFGIEFHGSGHRYDARSDSDSAAYHYD